MRRTPPSRRPAAVKLALVLVATLVVLLGSPPAARASVTPAQIKGAGSSWAYNSVQQWISDVQSKGLQVVYTPSGSATGRQDYAQGVTDYAVSDIGYQGVDKQTGNSDVSNRPYAYLPIVGGGTAFPYHITVGGQPVKNLRLSQQTLAKILCDQITNWDDPQITADNNGRQLPSIPIIPVVHSEGAGTTFQVTDWLNHLFPQVWQSFSGYNFPVEYWPSGKGSQVAENGSDGVISFINSGAGQGAIGFDEYSYALQAGLPVVNLENYGGYFVPPDQYNVAVALTQAQINTDKSSPNYLLQDLSKVWVYNDPRAYPLSSYSYFIEPTGTDAQDNDMNTGKRQTIVDYLTYSLCQGQAETGPIGYSPLPLNLVQASFDQLQKLQAADPNVSLQNVNVTQCNNPTFDPSSPNNNRLAEIAPQPPACDKAGQGPCVAGADVIIRNPTKTGQVPSAAVPVQASGPPGPSGTASPGAGAAGPGAVAAGTGATASAGSGSATGSGSAATGTGSSTVVGNGVAASSDPLSGSSTSSGYAGTGTAATAGSGDAASVAPSLAVTTLAADRVGGQGYAFLAALLVLLAVGLPPIITLLLARRRGPA